MTVRAKFVCSEKTSYNSSSAQKVLFMAQYDTKLVEEDVSFAKYTPSGKVEILVDNPNVDFELGKFYYLDFIPVEEG